MRPANLAVKFLLELAAFAALAVIGAHLGSGAWSVVLAVLLPLAAVVVWGRWNAPRSAHRLPLRFRAPLELVVLGGSGIGLILIGARWWGIVLVALVVLNAVGLSVLDQWES